MFNYVASQYKACVSMRYRTSFTTDQPSHVIFPFTYRKCVLDADSRLSLEPFVLQQFLCRWPVSRIELHDAQNECFVSV